MSASDLQGLRGEVQAALNVVNERLASAEALGEALHAVGGSGVPDWVHVYCQQVQDVRGACEALESVLWRGLLAGGVGGVAPDSGKGVSQPTSSIRGHHIDRARRSSRSMKPSSAASK